MQRLNYPLIIGLGVGVVVLGGGFFALYQYQRSRSAETYIKLADEKRDHAEQLLKDARTDEDRAEAREAFVEAIRFREAYLRTNRKDAEQLKKRAAEYAEMIEIPPTTPQEMRVTLLAYEQAVRVAPDDYDLRLEYVDVLMRLSVYPQAIDHLKAIRDGMEPSDVRMPEALAKLAECLARVGEDAKAREMFSQMIGYNEPEGSFDLEKATAPQTLKPYILLAAIYRERLFDDEKADQVIEQMVAANPESGEARLELGRYLMQWKSSESESRARAREVLDEALELDPDNLDIQLASAEAAMTEGDFDGAKAKLEKALKEHPHDPRVYRAKATWAWRQNEIDQAMAEVDKGLEEVADSRDLLYLKARLMIIKGEVAGVEEVIKQLQETRIAPHLLQFLRARVKMLQGEWRRATEDLKEIRPLMANIPSLAPEVEQSIGICFERTGKLQLALEAYRNVNRLRPGNMENLYAIARVLKELGRIDEAVALIEQLKAGADREGIALNPAFLEDSIRSAMAAELNKDERERDFSEIDAQVDALAANPDFPEESLLELRLDASLVKGDKEAARGYLAQGLEKFPNSGRLWLMKMRLETDEHGTEGGLAVLQEMKEALGDSAAYRLNLAQLSLANLGGTGEDIVKVDEAVAALKPLSQNVDEFSDSAKYQLFKGLGQIYRQLGQVALARDMFRKAAELNDNDVQLRIDLFDLAVQESNEEEMAKAIKAIENLTGPNSEEALYVKAKRLLWLARNNKGTAGSVQRAAGLIEEAMKTRPKWQPLVQLRAEAYLLQDSLDEAMETLEESLALGPVNPRIVRGLSQMLVRQGDFSQARRILQMIPAPARSLEDEKNLAQLEIELGGRIDPVVERMREEIPADSRNAEDRLWLGRLYVQAKKFDEAQKEIVTATELNPQLADAWLALIGLLAQTDKQAEAKEAIVRARENLPEEMVNLVLGQGYLAVRDFEKAEEAFLAALQEHPQSKPLLRQLAVFYLALNRPLDAETYLKKLLEGARPNVENPDPHVAWARRAKARLMAATNSYQDYLEALELIEANVPKGQAMGRDDLELVATLGAERPDSLSRQRAIELLKETENSRPLTNVERLMLARLYKGANRWRDCQEIMLSLLARDPNNPAIVAPWCQMLLSEGETKQVGRWLGNLSADSGDAIRIRAQLLVAQEKPDEALKLLRSLLPEDVRPQDAPRVRSIAGLLNELKLYEAAENLFRLYVQLQPNARLVLASFLASRGKIDECLDLCDESVGDQPIVAITQIGVDAVASLQGKKPTPEQLSRIRDWFAKARREAPDSKSLLLQEATLEQLLGNEGTAVQVYREYLGRTGAAPRERAIVQNNLAFILAMQGRGDDALELIEDAIDELGPTADLLDTEAMVHAARKDYSRARASLNRAITESPSPAKYLHLASVEFRAADLGAAAKALELARKNGLDAGTLMPTEREMYHRLSQALADQL